MALPDTFLRVTCATNETTYYIPGYTCTPP
jgi:hypothetical protein